MNKRFLKRLAAAVIVAAAQTFAEHVLKRQFRHINKSDDNIPS